MLPLKYSPSDSSPYFSYYLLQNRHTHFQYFIPNISEQVQQYWHWPVKLVVGRRAHSIGLGSRFLCPLTYFILLDPRYGCCPNQSLVFMSHWQSRSNQQPFNLESQQNFFILLLQAYNLAFEVTSTIILFPSYSTESLHSCPTTLHFKPPPMPITLQRKHLRYRGGQVAVKSLTYDTIM